MIPRKKLDIDWSDLWYGFASSIAPGAQGASTALPSQSLITLSVRSGFDLILQHLALPKGSEVLVSAITIQDMVKILDHHGLRAVPVDVDPETCAIKMEGPHGLEGRVTRNARAILIAHLFGTRMPMDAIVKFAQRHQLLVFEDCAQAFIADGNWGHPQSDFALFSFGPIKTATALGGGVMVFKDAEILEKVRGIQTRYPAQPESFLLKRVIKYSALKALSYRWPYWMFTRLLGALGKSHDQVINGLVRGFAGGDLIHKIRMRPSLALQRLLARRLATYAPRLIEQRKRAGAQLAACLEGVKSPGHAAETHSFWVFPILSRNPDELVAHLWEQGIDATRGASNLHAVPGEESGENDARGSTAIMSQVVYLPFYNLLSDADIQHIASAVAAQERGR